MIKKARKWQAKADKVIDRTITSEKTELISMPACVGSGKTREAAYGFGKFILENRNSETIQMFISPRIKLCDQQNKEVSTNMNEIFELVEGQDFKIIPVDCTKNDFDKKNSTLINETRHTIFVICDESLWGIDRQSADPNIRFHRWMSHFSKWQDEGKKFGCVFMDEAHNYSKHQMQMFGEEKF